MVRFNNNIAPFEPRSSEAFAIDPIGAYQSEQNWVYYAVHEDFFGYALWGAPEPVDLARLTDLWRRERHRSPHILLADCQQLTMPSVDVFAELARYVVEEAVVLSKPQNSSLSVRSRRSSAFVFSLR
jgi:hypothetical protein